MAELEHKTKLNFIQQLLSGSSTETDINDLEMVENHGVKLKNRHIIALVSINLLNQTFNIPEIDSFVNNYMEMRKLTPETNKDILKALEVRNNKKLLEKMTVGLKVGK